MEMVMTKYFFTFLLCALVFADFKVVGVHVDSLRTNGPELSVPNPNPPVGKNLVRDKRLGLPRIALAEPETVHICAVRVQFQPDENSRSTGNGQFDLSAPADTQKFDPPPHDKKYFSAHLDALARYYYFVSHGKLILNYDIYPDEDLSAYTLPDSMSYYGPSGWYGDNLSARLGGFFTDAMKLVDSLDTIDFCEYDIVIVFHAGSDWQNDIGSLYPDWAEIYPDVFIPSPDDLPTAFIVMPEDIVDCVGRGIVMPESPSQDGQIVLLNGVLAHEFGHAIGLVDLYSTYDFWTAVGLFTLMDSGHNIGLTLVDDSTDEEYTVSGAMPVYPSAWERAYLGWEQIVQLTEPTNFSLRACELVSLYETTSAQGTIAQISIDDFEYFLLENRQDVIWDTSASIALKQDSVTGVILGIQANSIFIGAYDFMLPSGGMLIWHIDERVAYGDFDDDEINNFSDNQLQWDWQHLFLDIVEADGIDDIGMWTGGEYALGTAEDMWSWPLANHFGPHTHPNTQNYDGGYTGIDVSDISRADTVMTFSFGYVGVHPDWKSLVGFPLENEITIADLDTDGYSEIMTTVENSDGTGLLFMWTADGEKYVANSDSILLMIYNGDTLRMPLPVAYEFDTFATSASVGDIDGDLINEIVLCDKSGNLCALEPTYSSGRLDVVSGFPIPLA